MKRKNKRMMLILVMSFVLTMSFTAQFTMSVMAQDTNQTNQTTEVTETNGSGSDGSGSSGTTSGSTDSKVSAESQGTDGQSGTDGKVTASTSTDGTDKDGTVNTQSNDVLSDSDKDEEQPKDAVDVDAIYLNGSSGSDDNDGTSADKAVKTFEKAKQIAKDSPSVTTIYVTGTADLTGDVSLDGTSAVVKRAEGMTGYLFKVKGTATLSNITIDGNNQSAEKSLIYVSDGTTLNITDGTVLENNVTGPGAQLYDADGGAVKVEDASLNMSGGTIQNNSACIGGGICLERSTMNMTGGTISGNKAVNATTRRDNYNAAGGGVGIYTSWYGSGKSSVFNFSGGTIDGNSSQGTGGGISLGDLTASDAIELNMTGGTISNNSSRSCGGGIFVQASGSGNQAVANVSGGNIINNHMVGYGYGNYLFGGGGIYVNGYPDGYGLSSGELHLINAIITDNTAAGTISGGIYTVGEGGGYAACPVAKTHIYLTDGAAIYGNKASNEAKDIYLLAANNLGLHSGDPLYTVSSSMLGGAPYHWKDSNGDEVPLNKLDGQLFADNNDALMLYTDEQADSAANSLGKVIISGNTSATNGGGIGTNGTVTIGVEDTTTLHVTKTWTNDNSADRPSSIKVQLYRHTEGTDPIYIGYETMSPDKDGNWELTFKNLPKADSNGNTYTYTVKEEPVDGYTATVTGSQAEGYTINNDTHASVSVSKVWNDSNNQYGIRPNSITVNLLADGEKVDSKTVTAADGWKCTFSDLVKKGTDGKEITYTVSEDSINNYTSKVTGSAKDGFTITNKSTYTPPTPTPTPSYTTFTVNKVWNLQAGQTAPSSVQVQLYKNGVLYDTQSVTAAQNWTYTWASLPLTENGSIINWTVQEVNPDNAYQVSILSSANSATITNTPNALSPSTTQVTVNKVWKLDNGGTAAASVQAQLYQNGAAYGDPVTLSAATNWAYTWDKLPKADASGNAYTWTVKEVNVPSGFSSSVTGEDNSFTITNDDNNTPVNPKTPDNPDNPDNPNTPNTPSTPGKSTTTTTTTVTNKTVTAKSPQTGDSSQVGLYAGLLTAAVAGAAALLIWKRRKDD